MITEFTSLDGLPSAARALFGHGAFSTLAWYGSILAAALPPAATPCFLVVENGANVDAVFPMLRASGAMAALTSPYTCLWSPLIAQGLSTDRLVEIGRGLASVWRRAGVVRLEALAAPDPAMETILAGLRASGLYCLRFDHFGNWHIGVAGLDWDAYLASRPGTLRTSILRARKRLVHTRGAIFTLVESAAGLDEAINAYETVYAASWKEPEPFPCFNAALMRACAADGLLRLGTLTLDGAPIAAQFWMVRDGWAGVQKLAHDEAQRALAPGTVLTALMIRHLLEVDHVKELDFGRGDDAYKRLWTGARRQRVGVLVVNPFSLAGSVAIARHGVGLLRRQFRSSPDPLAQAK